MGESLVETPTVEEKMGESMTHVPCLQESVSFGRFEHDSLCWERWSTFPTNKYLEEVEKCSTPGSVAQKRAYFEAHYKRIAARKAELLDQEKKRETESLNSEDQRQNLMDSVCNSSEDEVEVEKSNTHDPVYGTELENKLSDFTEEVSDVHIDVPVDGFVFIDEENEENLMGEVGDSYIAVPSDGTSTVIEENEVANFEHNSGADVIEEKEIQPQPEFATEDLCSEKRSIELKPDEPDFVKEEAASTLVSQDKEVDTELRQDKVEQREMDKKETEDVVIVETSKKMQKVTSKTNNSRDAKKKTATPMSKGSAARMPKNSATPTPKSSMLSTPKLSKPVQSKTLMSATRSSVKKENGFTPMSTKKAARSESKMIVPTSLHMSLSLGPANSDPAALTTRKSLIMERMGDKDIVKRAFKAFEKCNLLSPTSLSRSPAINQHVTKKIEQKGSGTGTLQKKNEEISRSVKAAGPCSGQQGTVKASLLPGLRKTIGVDQSNGKSTPSSFGSRSPNLGSKQKEVSKKLEQKSITKENGKTHLSSKLEKATEIRRPSQSTNSKANLSSSCDKGRVSKVLLKEDGKTKASG